jgi:hypothetical protein
MKKNDEIFPVTRWVAVLVVPFLWLAYLILFFFPDSTGVRFAWAIKPHMTSLFMGAGYLGGSWLFLNAIFGKRWHRIQGGFLAVTTFTWFMLLSTFLHWGKFSHGRLGFNLWLILYAVTPVLVPALWFFNRKTDPHQPEEQDAGTPAGMGWLLKLIGLAGLAFAVIGFVDPTMAMRAWPWTLTALTARVMCGWIALLSVGALSMSFEARWSGWKVPLESIVIWHGLVLVAAAMNPGDFKASPVNWYTVAIGAMLVGIFILYGWMEKSRRRT